MSAWQQRLRIALGLAVAAFAVVVLLSLRGGRLRPIAEPVPRLDPTATVESTGGLAVQFKGTREQFKVESAETFLYANGARRLVGVRVTISKRAGRDFVLTGQEAEVGANDSAVTLKGSVTLTSEDGLTVAADAASYSQTDGMVRVPGPVRFSRGRMNGSGVGLTYDQQRDVIWILDQALVTLAPDDKGQGGARITAGAAGHARAEHYLRFERGVRVIRAGRALEADSGMAVLSDDDSRVRRVELRGGSRVVGGGREPGSLQSMSARDMDLTYAEEGETLQDALLAGQAAVQLAGERGGRGRRIAGDWIHIGLAADGTTVTGLTSRDRVVVDLPPEGEAPARQVRAEVLEATGTPETGITSAAFTGSVEFREFRPDVAPRVAHAKIMSLAVKPGFGTVESARFAGGVRFVEGDLTAVARDARYIVATGQINLEGDDEVTGRPPQVVDERVAIAGRRLEIVLDGRRVLATGAVNSVLQPAHDAAGASQAPTAGGSGSERLPGLLKQDQPAYVTAEQLAYDGAANRAVYTGAARLWQGETTIAGDSITLDEKHGDLQASGSVRTTLVLYQVDDRTKKREKVVTIGSAASLVYRDEARQAVFERGPAAQAHLNGSQGDLTADRIRVFLRPSGDEVERLEASGEVRILLAQGRVATGTHLTYTAADEQYLMTGTPVKIEEECRETTGRVLTFYKSIDRIVAAGNEEIRTQTKTGAKCSEPRRH